ncbi:MAG: hypothetical protein E7401_02435 [Ruminococcaceae bacterium]|nr:hypothetical protein [Oscillospiraceae bacterium]
MTVKKKIAAVVLICALMILNVNIYFAEEQPVIETPEEKEDVIIPVLMYHNIAETYPASADGANITPKRFEEHMQGILDRGYTPIFVADYYNSGREENLCRIIQLLSPLMTATLVTTKLPFPF